MAQPVLDGPRAAPASGGPARQLVVFLHGLGADGDDLFGLAPYFATRMPDAAFVSPHAPFACDMAPYGRQWFSLQDRSAGPILKGVRAAAPILDGFLDTELARHGLTDRDLVLVGFSQGTMMALHVGLRRKAPCAALVGYSGRLIGPELLPAELTARPRVLLIHGEDDPVVDPVSLPQAKSVLEKVGVPVLSLLCAGLGHSIDEEGLAAGIEFVVQGIGA
jgi:phospholipase/carboxylesterase